LNQQSSFFSPKTVADAIGVSESSLKRWCDKGKIAATKTAGGHRRLAGADIVAFLRDQQIPLRNPELIGFPAHNSQVIRDVEDAREQLLECLLLGEDRRCRDLLVYLFANLWPLEKVVDDVIVPVFRQIGERWQQGSLDVYQERRACEICMAALRELQSLLPPTAAGAPKAIGGSVAHDHYSLPTYAVQLTLQANRWHARSLGSNLPFNSFRKAVDVEQPRLLWISISHIDSAAELQQELNDFAAEISRFTTLVIGGQAVTTSIRSGLKSVVCCDNMSQLLAFTNSLRADG
jgi:excisionase family DNA binding protein